jgi:WD40 repeat protein
MLEECPSETYRSALLFLSPSSLILQTYRASFSRYLPTQLCDGDTPNSISQSSLASLQFSPNGRVIGGISLEGRGGLWDAHTGDLLHELGENQDTPVNSMAFSSNSRLLALGSSQGTVHVWELSALGLLNNEPSVLEVDSVNIKCLVFSPSNSHLACGGVDGSLILWSLKNQRWQIQLHWGTGPAIETLAFSHSGDRVASLDESGTLKIYNLTDLDTLAEVPLASQRLSEGPSYLSFSADDQTLAVCIGGTLGLFDVPNNMKQFVSLQGRTCAPHFSMRNGVEYLYWDRWVFDYTRIPRDDLVQEENGVTYLTTTTSDSIRTSLIYLQENMTTVRSYRAEAPLMTLPASWKVRCWSAFQQRIAIGQENGQMRIIDVEYDASDGASVYSTASEGDE